MTLVINSSYQIHKSAIDFLQTKNIQLNIVINNSPYYLATHGAPNIVFHPLSHMIKNGEFPEVKFFGPKCIFPNYEYTPSIGYSDHNIKDTKQLDVEADIVFINTVNDIALIKYLESLNMRLAIFGRPCNSLYYYGPQTFDSYSLYKTNNVSIIAVDNEQEALKALRISVDGSMAHMVSGFDYDGCMNFRNKNKTTQLDYNATLVAKNWKTIFTNLRLINNDT
jgi:hypothetical protein